MTFRNSPRFPEAVSYGFAGGPGWNTEVVELDDGDEQRNQLWSRSLREYEAAHGLKTQAQLDELYSLFELSEGQTHGFRLKDWTDFAATYLQGRLGAVLALTAAGTGLGVPQYHLFKRRSWGAVNKDRLCCKIVAASYTIYRNYPTPVTEGAAAGNFSLDIDTGIVTFVANDSEAITGHTPGASHVFTTAADMAGLAIGEKVYITGVTGTAAASLNSLAHTISNKTGAGPYTWTLSTSTAGLTASGGTAFEYPQASDALTAAFEFDVPCRFATDKMRVRVDEYNAYTWGQIPLIELRYADAIS